MGTRIGGLLMILFAGAVVLWVVDLADGRGRGIRKVEKLEKPRAVRGWVGEGLVMADGTVLEVAGVRGLPVESRALGEFVKRGVEVDGKGRLVVLCRVHHWCGNDPVREHVARVDLAEALVYLRVGTPDVAVDSDYLVREPGGKFTEWGWNVSEYSHFNAWRDRIAEALERGKGAR